MPELTDFSFERNYRCELLDELPSPERTRRHFFPDFAGGQDGLLVLVTPEDVEPWTGMFAFGKLKAPGISRVLSWPDAEKVCVISRGAGYIVNVSDPVSWEPVMAVPIIDARAVPSAGLVVFSNLTELVAYGAAGVRWRTKRLAWDGLKIVELTELSIIGEYLDIRTETLKRFEVDLADGRGSGGVET